MQKLSYSLIIVFVLNSIILSQKSPHGDDFTMECSTCHSTDSWEIKNSNFDHGSTEFELLGQHKDVSCKSCHVSLKFTNTEMDCQSCHTDIHQNSVGFDCQRCHTSNSWIVTDITEIHNMSRFPLLGSHRIADCNECHESNSLLNFKPLGVTCYDCHISDYQSTTSPNHIASNYSTDCENCHSLNNISWGGAGIVHDFFPLTGGHSIGDCFSCHNQNGFEGLSPECNTCHQNDYNNTSNPSHLSLGFSVNCQECHSISGWKPASFDHDSRFFPIYSGKHNGEWNECSDCHTNQNDYAAFSCFTCHEHNSSDMNKEHSGINGYVYESNACFACHPRGDSDDSFSHTTAFPLVGSHSEVTCSECHTVDYNSTSSECNSCHQSSFDNAQNPNHVAAGLSQQCELCHSASNWNQSSFNHTNTGFELVGSHATVDCSSCHDGNTTSAVQECFACHEENYNSAKDHLAQKFPQECQLCHTSVNWTETSFNHDLTSFPLTGAHVNSDCNACHASGYAGTSMECSSCHQTNFDNSTNPNHGASGISLQCASCHSTVAWVPSTFSHTETGFELVGAHVTVDCSECHSINTSNATPECFACHEDGYNNAEDHLAQNYPKECEVCHNTVNWLEATFDHSVTNFPLTGAHVNSDCSECHVSGYSGTSTECSSCHQIDFDNSTNPNHKSLGLSTTCSTCHTTDPNWEPASFPNHNNYYQLLGAHATIANNCIDCHNSDYNNTPTDCFGCHESDYNGTTDPSHTSAQFSTDCETCHSVNAWSPSTFDHDSQYFPIYSGKHRNEWNQCSECHTIQNNYSLFSCIDCHEHSNKSEVDNDHNEVNNYVYESTACYDCHPKGDGDDGGIQKLKIIRMH